VTGEEKKKGRGKYVHPWISTAKKGGREEKRRREEPFRAAWRLIVTFPRGAHPEDQPGAEEEKKGSPGRGAGRQAPGVNSGRKRFRIFRNSPNLSLMCNQPERKNRRIYPIRRSSRVLRSSPYLKFDSTPTGQSAVDRFRLRHWAAGHNLHFRNHPFELLSNQRVTCRWMRILRPHRL